MSVRAPPFLQGIINATGPFSDGLRKMDDPSIKEIVAPSSGVHITLPAFMGPKQMGLLDPVRLSALQSVALSSTGH